MSKYDRRVTHPRLRTTNRYTLPFYIERKKVIVDPNRKKEVQVSQVKYLKSLHLLVLLMMSCLRPT